MFAVIEVRDVVVRNKTLWVDAVLHTLKASACWSQADLYKSETSLTDVASSRAARDTSWVPCPHLQNKTDTNTKVTLAPWRYSDIHARCTESKNIILPGKEPLYMWLRFFLEKKCPRLSGWVPHAFITTLIERHRWQEGEPGHRDVKLIDAATVYEWPGATRDGEAETHLFKALKVKLHHVATLL